ncbi:MAG: hypothetical protein FJW96_16530 [Actinobacteria bacterium]|nr:hypothetical protein [Actinomycetota bacterium]
MSVASLTARATPLVMACVAVGGCARIVGADFDGLVPPSGAPAADAGAGTGAGRDAGPRADAEPEEDNLYGTRLPAPAADSVYFGLAVALDGDVAAVGGGDADWVGSVHIARRPTPGWWLVQDAPLTAGEDRARGTAFGAHVALSGRDLLVGAPGYGTGTPAGAAYLFHDSETAWDRRQKLTAPTPAPMDRFGQYVALEGELALVSAPGSSFDATVLGALHVYRRGRGDTYVHAQTIDNPAAAGGDAFGEAFTLSGDTLVVTSSGDDERAENAGAAYVYTLRDGAFILDQKLMPSAADPHWHKMGWGTVGVGDGVIVVPALGSVEGGYVYAYSRDDSGRYVEEPLDPPPGTTPTTGFGWRAAIEGRTLILAVRQADRSHALIYRREDGRWRFDRKFWADADSPDQFGYYLAFDGATAAVSAVRDVRNAGTVWFFDVPP